MSEPHLFAQTSGLNAARLFGAFCCTSLGLLILLAGLLFIEESRDYKAAKADPVEFEAQVTYVTRDEDNDYLTIKFRDRSGRVIREKREVFLTWEHQYIAGDTITLQHKAGDPEHFFVKDIDAVQRNDKIGIGVLWFAWAILALGIMLMKGALFAKHTTARRSIEREYGELWLKHMPSNLIAPCRTLPDRHEAGAVVFTQLRAVGNDKSHDFTSHFPGGWEKLRDLGVRAKKVGETYLVVDAENARRLFENIEGFEDYQGNYFILKRPDVKAATQWAIHTHNSGLDRALASEELSFALAKGRLGPLTAPEAKAILHQWITDEIKQACKPHAIDLEIDKLDVAKVFDLTGHPDDIRLMILKSPGKLAVYLWRKNDNDATLAELTLDGWTVRRTAKPWARPLWDKLVKAHMFVLASPLVVPLLVLSFGLILPVAGGSWILRQHKLQLLRNGKTA